MPLLLSKLTLSRGGTLIFPPCTGTRDTTLAESDAVSSLRTSIFGYPDPL